MGRVTSDVISGLGVTEPIGAGRVSNVLVDIPCTLVADILCFRKTVHVRGEWRVGRLVLATLWKRPSLVHGIGQCFATAISIKHPPRVLPLWRPSSLQRPRMVC